jgi:hypothetical protein
MDYVVQDLRRKSALNSVVAPQLLEQLLGQFPNQSNRVLRIAIVEGTQRPFQSKPEQSRGLEPPRSFPPLLRAL